MNRAVRTGLTLGISVLLSTLSMAQSSNDKDNNKQHHSRLAKVAFWRHQDDGTKQKQAQPIEKSSNNHAPAAQLKPTSAKTSQAKSPAPNPNQKQVQHAAVNKKPAGKSASASKPVSPNKTSKSSSKTSTATKTTPRQKAPVPQAVSLKQ